MLNAQDRIYNLLKTNDGWLSSGEIDTLSKINQRSYTSLLLSKLVAEKKIIKKREGRHILYRQNFIFLEDTFTLISANEDDVFKTARNSKYYQELASDKANSIFCFAFTEMFNNAKDHSKSKTGYVKIWEEQNSLKFIVKDNGIGVFRNIKKNRNLPSEHDAILNLIKGKLTTRPSNHSGEGIFWTSKMSDRFSLSSYGYVLYVDNFLNDYTIEKIEPGTDNYINGTEVKFEISIDSQKSTKEIFAQFSLDHENYSFDTTEIPLKLYTGGDFWVSRSQAKRILSGLEKYKRIIIDFNGIDLIGQGFADEIFRVFNIAHPNIILEPINMSESVKMMVERAINDSTGR